MIDSGELVNAVLSLSEEVAALRRQHNPEPTQLLTTAQKARETGLSARWLRVHAGELGAVRIGSGSRPRLYFPAGPLRVTNRGSQTSNGLIHIGKEPLDNDSQGLNGGEWLPIRARQREQDANL